MRETCHFCLGQQEIRIGREGQELCPACGGSGVVGHAKDPDSLGRCIICLEEDDPLWDFVPDEWYRKEVREDAEGFKGY